MDIKQEILDWYNEGLDEGEKSSYLGSYAFQEFVYALKKKEWLDSHPEATTPVLDSGTAYLVIDQHGEDGDYEARYVVFQVGDKLYEADGYYSSWDGDNWDDAEPYEVEAYTETVTRYRKK